MKLENKSYPKLVDHNVRSFPEAHAIDNLVVRPSTGELLLNQSSNHAQRGAGRLNLPFPIAAK